MMSMTSCEDDLRTGDGYVTQCSIQRSIEPNQSREQKHIAQRQPWADVVDSDDDGVDKKLIKRQSAERISNYKVPDGCVERNTFLELKPEEPAETLRRTQSCPVERFKDLEDMGERHEGHTDNISGLQIVKDAEKNNVAFESSNSQDKRVVAAIKAGIKGRGEDFAESRMRAANGKGRGKGKGKTIDRTNRQYTTGIGKDSHFLARRQSPGDGNEKTKILAVQGGSSSCIVELTFVPAHASEPDSREELKVARLLPPQPNTPASSIPAFPSSLPGGSPPRKTCANHALDSRDCATNNDLLLQRISKIHPEIATKLVDYLRYYWGPHVVEQCLGCDKALHEYLRKAVPALFENEEDQSAPPELDARHFNNSKRHMPSGFAARPADQPIDATPVRQRTQPSKVPVQQSKTTTFSAQAPGIGVRQRPLPTPRPQVIGNAMPKREVKRPDSACVDGRHGDVIGACCEKHVWGVEDFMEKLDLSEYLMATKSWAQTMGAAFLEELIENQEDLAEALRLKPLERRRLERQGPEVARLLVQWRPPTVVGRPPLFSPIASLPIRPPAAATSNIGVSSSQQHSGQIIEIL